MFAELSEHANKGRQFLERAPDRRDSFSPVAGTLQRPRSSVASLHNSRTRVARGAASRVPGVAVLVFGICYNCK